MKNNIESFVKESIKNIQKGLPKNFEIVEDIQFEISVSVSENTGGGLDIKLISGKLEDKTEVVQKIKFSVRDAKQADRAARQKVNDLIEFGGKLMVGFSQLSDALKDNNKLNADNI